MYLTVLQSFANDRTEVQVTYAYSIFSSNNLYYAYRSNFFHDEVSCDILNN